MFEQMAHRYDTEDRILVAKAIAAEIRRHVGDGTGKRAVDYGCGTGLVGLELTDLFDSILLVDGSNQMVQQVRGKIAAGGLQKASALCCDLMAEDPGDFPELRADCVILAQVLLHIRDVPAILTRLHGLLNGGGHLLIVDFNTEESIVSELVHSGFDQDTLIRQCKSAGFAAAGAETFYRGKNLFMGRDASLFLLDAAKQ